jgi:hypothetical protein
MIKADDPQAEVRAVPAVLEEAESEDRPAP